MIPSDTPATIREFHGSEILAALDALAELRIKVFRDWPYLYGGDPAYERQYLTTYAASPRAYCALAEVDGVAIGATTAVPLDIAERGAADLDYRLKRSVLRWRARLGLTASMPHS